MFLPKKSDIFERLVKQSSLVEETAQTFKELTERWSERKAFAAKLSSIEHEADEHVHAITDTLEKTFILPLDKEDLKELTEYLDDIVDGIEQAANRIVIYEIPRESNELKEFATVLLETAENINKGVQMLARHELSSQNFSTCYKTIHELENRGDAVHRGVVATLMKERSGMSATDLLLAFKWKEVFQMLEDTLDTCEDIAAAFEQLRIKYQ